MKLTNSIIRLAFLNLFCMSLLPIAWQFGNCFWVAMANFAFGYVTACLALTAARAVK